MLTDAYYYKLCNAVATESRCLSRQIGAILVKDGMVVSHGNNSPPEGVPSCSFRYANDKNLIEKLKDVKNINTSICPRRALNFPSGEGLEWCVAIHAEKNCLINLTKLKLRIDISNSTLYLNTTITPCSQCFGSLINAGITEIVCLDIYPYDISVPWLIDNSKIKLRKFEL